MTRAVPMKIPGGVESTDDADDDVSTRESTRPGVDGELEVLIFEKLKFEAIATGRSLSIACSDVAVVAAIELVYRFVDVEKIQKNKERLWNIAEESLKVGK